MKKPPLKGQDRKGQEGEYKKKGVDAQWYISALCLHISLRMKNQQRIETKNVESSFFRRLFNAFVLLFKCITRREVFYENAVFVNAHDEPEESLNDAAILFPGRFSKLEILKYTIKWGFVAYFFMIDIGISYSIKFNPLISELWKRSI